jgi:hypothetical protein
LLPDSLLSIIPPRLMVQELQPYATDFASTMTRFNVYGQTALMLLKLRNRQTFLTHLAAAAEQEIDELDLRIQELEQEEASARKTEAYLQRVRGDLAGKDQHEIALRGSIDTLKRKSGVKETQAYRLSLANRNRPRLQANSPRESLSPSPIVNFAIPSKASTASNRVTSSQASRLLFASRVSSPEEVSSDDEGDSQDDGKSGEVLA